MSCDHHDESGSVPDNRSRKRMLEQFAAASAFGDAFLEMVRGSDLAISALAHGAPLLEPTITISTARFLDAWVAYYRWHQNRPQGDDLWPPVDPPSTIRVPPIDDDPGPAATMGGADPPSTPGS